MVRQALLNPAAVVPKSNQPNPMAIPTTQSFSCEREEISCTELMACPHDSHNEYHHITLRTYVTVLCGTDVSKLS